MSVIGAVWHRKTQSHAFKTLRSSKISVSFEAYMAYIVQMDSELDVTKNKQDNSDK